MRCLGIIVVCSCSLLLLLRTVHSIAVIMIHIFYDQYVYYSHLMKTMLAWIYLTHLSWVKFTCFYHGLIQSMELYIISFTIMSSWHQRSYVSLYPHLVVIRFAIILYSFKHFHFKKLLGVGIVICCGMDKKCTWKTPVSKAWALVDCLLWSSSQRIRDYGIISSKWNNYITCPCEVQGPSNESG